MRISACYIVKNEENNLPKSLNSLASIVDEIIVVDTGSTDKTVEIASSFGARIYKQIWRDNFALHRNFALQQATGDWIIFLDADEYFVNIEGLDVYLQRADRYPACEGLLLPLLNINPDTDSGQPELIEKVLSLRVWRNKKNYRFTGCVHEQLYVSESGGNMRPLKTIVAHDKFTLHHTGYRRGVMKEKYERYLEMLLTEMEQNGEQPLTARYLADCYFGLGDYEQAAYYASRAITREQQLGIVTVAGYYKLYRYWLEAGKKLCYTDKKLLSIAEKAITDTVKEGNGQAMYQFIDDLFVGTGLISER